MANIIAKIIEVGLDLSTAFRDAINTSLKNLAQKDVDNYNELNGRIGSHVSGLSEKHPAQDISYSGLAGGAEVNTALDNLKADVNNLSSMPGTEHDPLVTAALVDKEGTDFGSSGLGTFLDGRLQKWEQIIMAHLAETLKYEGKEFKINNPYENGGSLPLKVQLHAHSSNGSGGADTPVVLGTAYKGKGYAALAITDHDVVTPPPLVDGLITIQSVEETNSRHVTAYDISAQSTSMDTQTVINDHRSRSELCSIAHPSWVTSPIGDLEMLMYYDNNFQEIFNNGLNDELLWDKVLTSGKKVFGLAGDDCHDITSASFDSGWVVVFCNERTKEAILQSLRNGNFYASTGNDITISVEDEVVNAHSTASSNIVFIGENGRILQTNNGVTSASYTIKGDELYVRVRSTRVSDSKVAWSQPVFLDYKGAEQRTTLPLIKSLVKCYRRKNWLRNPFFKYTLNQRGASVYSADGYCNDGWRTYNGAVVTLTGDEVTNVSYSGGSANKNIYCQYIEFPERFRGKTMTAAFAVEVTSGSVKVVIEDGVGHGGNVIDSTGISIVTYKVSDAAARLYVAVFSASTDPVSFKPICAMLEEGEFSTMDENEVPDPEKQLSTCQRYGVALPGKPATFSVIASTLVAESATSAVGIIPLPVSLREGTAVLSYIGTSVVGNFYLRNSADIAATNIAVSTISKNGIKVIVTVAGGLTPNQAYQLTTRAIAAALFISVEL